MTVELKIVNAKGPPDRTFVNGGLSRKRVLTLAQTEDTSLQSSLDNCSQPSVHVFIGLGTRSAISQHTREAIRRDGQAVRPHTLAIQNWTGQTSGRVSLVNPARALIRPSALAYESTGAGTQKQGHDQQAARIEVAQIQHNQHDVWCDLFSRSLENRRLSTESKKRAGGMRNITEAPRQICGISNTCPY